MYISYYVILFKEKEYIIHNVNFLCVLGLDIFLYKFIITVLEKLEN